MVGTVTTDLSKAFDLISHNLLLAKLHSFIAPRLNCAYQVLYAPDLLNSLYVTLGVLPVVEISATPITGKMK